MAHGFGEEVDRFVAELVRTGRRRIDLNGLWSALRAVDPEAASAPDRRERLRMLLDDAERAGKLCTTARQDNSASPTLPRSIRLVGVDDQQSIPPKPRPVWPASLDWATELRLRHDERVFLERVRAFLRDLSPDEPIVPLRERSLQIAGDEKWLDAHCRGRLFGSGRLTLELLRCKQVHPPFVHTRTGEARVLLVVENHHSYDTFARLLEASDGIGFLAYGAGNQFTASVTYVRELEPQVERVLYFGDIDLEGLWIPMQASRKAESEGLPSIEPATGLYRALLSEGRRGRSGYAADGKMKPREVVAWLPPDLRAPALELLEAGERVAQEGLGYARLRNAQFRRQALR